MVATLPACERDVEDAVADAMRDGVPLAIVGGGSKSAIGRDTDARELSLAGLSGIVDYDPPELTLTVKPGTRLDAVETLLAGSGQMLAFDPFDYAPIFGRAPGVATIGGVTAAGVAGSRRVSGGGARDHLLGFRAVSGRGETFAAGGRVVKNVTGFDLSKLACGSWGRLFAITELTFKVVPKPQECLTLALAGLDLAQALRAMSLALGSSAAVAAAAHFPAAVHDGESLTVLRLEGFGPSMQARRALLESALTGAGAIFALSPGEGEDAWRALRTLSALPAGETLWRISVPPRRAADVAGKLGGEDARFLLDWAGGLMWLVSDADPIAVRAAAESAGGHASLIRAAQSVRLSVPAFHPPSPGIAGLEARVRRAFDPAGLFETGRF